MNLTNHRIARLLLWVLRITHRYKDNSLASLIHETAGLYQTRPQEGWKPPVEWPRDDI